MSSFPSAALFPSLSPVYGHASLEVGLVGDEGVLGVPVTLGVNVSPLQALVQLSGTALRISAATFRRELESSPALRRGMNRYIYVLMAQRSQVAA